MSKEESYLKQEQINSAFLKKELMSHMYFHLGFPIIVDEYNFMDVFGIRDNGYMVEFEVKISKEDLMREIKLMKCNQPIKYSKEWVKWEKHANYLKRTILEIPNRYGFISDHISPPYFVPNEFYFYVPDFLEEVALRETLNTPYGVVKIGKTSHNGGISHFFWRYEVVKKAVKLHTNKATDELYRRIAHSLTIRNRLLHLS